MTGKAEKGEAVDAGERDRRAFVIINGVLLEYEQARALRQWLTNGEARALFDLVRAMRLEESDGAFSQASSWDRVNEAKGFRRLADRIVELPDDLLESLQKTVDIETARTLGFAV